MNSNYGINGNNALKMDDTYISYLDSSSAAHVSRPHESLLPIKQIMQELKLGTATGIAAKPFSRTDKIFAGFIGIISTCILVGCIVLPALIK